MMNQVSRSEEFVERGDPPDVRMRKEWERLGEDAFVNALLERGDGHEMYKALARIPFFTTEARNKVLAAIASSKHPDGIMLTYAHYKGMPQVARAALVAAAIEAGDPRVAYCLLGDKAKLEPGVRRQLVDIASRDSFYADCTRDYCSQITNEERRILADAANPRQLAS